ncbi:hypothetical protein CASFOL_036157 [Castilleja foliolosa]|uniref:Protein kinase domain-containing protein n=1 Tax=Castilleja foliolosa TaxID=1961234 RepID=A0ABD3BUU3_9LAMI
MCVWFSVKFNEVGAKMVDQRSRIVFIFLPLFFLLFGFTIQQRPSISRHEKLALLRLRSSLGLRAREWPIRSDPCISWAGIQCTNGRVIGINISGFRRTRRARRNPQFSVDALRNLTLLSSFNASNFALPGPIPEWLGLQLDALQVLDLRFCSINGSIPSTLGNLTSLVELYLSHNNLTGSIPARLSNLSSLAELDLGFNSLSGPMPLDLSGLRNLSRMIIGSNFLSGSLSGNLFPSLSQLRFVDLSRNQFIGQFPDVLWSMPNLRSLDVSMNNFTGLLPNVSSRVNNNNASGTVFNISRNLFYGNITPVISGFNFVDMSGNYFEGPVPIYARGPTSLLNNCLQNSTSQRSVTECFSFYAERNLVFDNFGEPNASQPPPSGNRSGNHRSAIILGSVFGGIGLIALVIITVALIIVCKCKRRGPTNQSGMSVGPVPAGGNPPTPPRGAALDFSDLGMLFTYQQIVQATGEFKDDNLIKNGRSSDLFNGVLEDGIRVVIKRFGSDKKESYVSELELFSKVSHHRFVPFLGHCLENENEKFLVYKHLPNGDLSSSLFRKTSSDESLQSLDWITRLKIAIGAAEGLSYLHHECTPPLVHRDVQASSILLDDKFEVRLGSLSEVCAQEGDTHPNRITRFLWLPQSSDQGASGTSNATCAYDVYCFGKVLLELVTGKLGISSPTDPTSKELLDSTLPHISIYDKDLVTNIVDPSLIIDEDLLEEVWAMAIVARSCLNPKPNRRPLMRYILKALENPLKVVRDEQHTSSDRFRTMSSRGSWNAALFGSWRHSSSDVAAHPAAAARKVEGSSSGKRSGTTGSQGSMGNNGGESNNGNSSSARRGAREIVPEPLDEED